jgi:hypothetical protein
MCWWVRFVRLTVVALLAEHEDKIRSMLPKLLTYDLHRTSGGSKRGALFDNDYLRICKEYVMPPTACSW